jgi:hypothetical protein
MVLYPKSRLNGSSFATSKRSFQRTVLDGQSTLQHSGHYVLCCWNISGTTDPVNFMCQFRSDLFRNPVMCISLNGFCLLV